MWKKSKQNTFYMGKYLIINCRLNIKGVKNLFFLLLLHLKFVMQYELEF